MHNINQNVILFLKRFVLVLVTYQLSRILFFVLNRELFEKFTFKIFIGGVVFDLAVISYINVIFLFLHVVPWNFKYKPIYQSILKIAFYTVNLIFLSTNFIDIIYYRFTGRRSTFALITARGMENDTLRLIPSFLKDFWYVAVLFIIISIIFWKLTPDPKGTIVINKLTKKDYFKKSAYLVVLLLGILLIARGGFRKKPIRIVDAVEYGEANNAGLILNTPFSILKTLFKKEDIDNTPYFDSKELSKTYNPIISLKSGKAPIKKNVVIIILESFGNENIGRGQTPFLDSLITKSCYFKNGFANGKVSIDAVPSIISSIPSLMNNSFISSSYALNKVHSLPKIFKEQGYTTSFFHGAFNGSQNFDEYAKVAGFDHYFGKNEYVGKESYDGKWGIFDEEFLQFYANKLSTFKKPFFSSVFTISSHVPYIIPAKYHNKFPKGTTDIHESVAYADYSLRKFFETAKKQNWYKNTLFVLSADHTSSGGDHEGDQTNIGKFRIPILFFDPSNPKLVGVNEKNFQQIDIMPSILDYLHIDTDIVSFGKSYKSKENFVVYYLQGTYHYIQDDYYVAFTDNKLTGLYNWKKDTLLKNNLIKIDKPRALRAEKFIKAYIQSFNERVMNNQLLISDKKNLS